VPNDSGVGSSQKRLPRGSKKRERAEATINAWLSQVGTDELVSLANFLDSKVPADTDPRDLANEVASAIPRLLSPIKNPSIQTTLGVFRAPSVPDFKSLNKKAQDDLRAELPKGAPLLQTYNEIQNAIFIYVTARWTSLIIAEMPNDPETNEMLRDISKSIKRLISSFNSASIRLFHIFGKMVTANTPFPDAFSLIKSLREIETSISWELRLQRKNKIGAPKQPGNGVDDHGEIPWERWQTSTGQQPTASPHSMGVISFAQRLTTVAPIQAEIVRKMEFPDSDRRPLVEAFSVSLKAEDISAAVESALRARRTDRTSTVVSGSE